ncbi:MAG TPA: alpha/beta hydrolase [Streptosporangiaceae bacterium]|nr:alpha/beta hydrolase [Streptosporangiaceae bacterium]
MVTAAIAAGCTLLALAPLRRPFALGVLSFLLTLALNEVPFLGFYYLLASTLLALSQGGIDAPGSRAAAGLAVLATAGLAVIAWRGLRAGPAVARALDEGLGAGWRGAVDPALAARRRRLPLARILFAPLAFRRRDVERLANISYGPAGRQNQLDVYRHRARPAGAPVLVHLHGGALFTGKKNRESLALLYRLASQGWVCISANYRLSPAARFPDHLIDAKKVIAWVREHGPEHGADPAVLVLAGSSAGAQLAALAALTPGDPAYQPGFEDADTSVSAAVCLYGYYGRPAAREAAPDSPLAYDGTDAPPFFVAHGDHDSLIPVAAARLFAGRLRAASASPVVYAELPGAQHGFDRFNSLRFEAVVDGIEAFAAWVRSGRAAAGDGPARYDAAR